jgi:hypothetical protein
VRWCFEQGQLAGEGEARSQPQGPERVLSHRRRRHDEATSRGVLRGSPQERQERVQPGGRAAPAPVQFEKSQWATQGSHSLDSRGRTSPALAARAGRRRVVEEGLKVVEKEEGCRAVVRVLE